MPARPLPHLHDRKAPPFAARPHALDHHASFRAVVAAAAPLAALAAALARAGVAADLNGMLASACGDLAQGYAAPPGSPRRTRAHHRAWITVRGIDRVLREVHRRRLAAPDVLARAQRVVDRADVMIAALPGVLPA